MDCEGRTIWIADAHRDDGKRFVVYSDEKADGVFGIGKGGLYPPIERTMLTIIAAMAASRYVVRADEKLTAFMEFESAIRNGV